MNTIKIKHGNGEPNGKLLPYELGYRDDTGALYINNGKCNIWATVSRYCFGLNQQAVQ